MMVCILEAATFRKVGNQSFKLFRANLVIRSCQLVAYVDQEIADCMQFRCIFCLQRIQVTEAINMGPMR